MQISDNNVLFSYFKSFKVTRWSWWFISAIFYLYTIKGVEHRCTYLSRKLFVRVWRFLVWWVLGSNRNQYYDYTLNTSLAVVDCGEPPSVTNGIIHKQSGTTYLSEVHYFCRPGYTLQGARQGTCMANGSWSGTGTKCLGLYSSHTAD